MNKEENPTKTIFFASENRELLFLNTKSWMPDHHKQGGGTFPSWRNQVILVITYKLIANQLDQLIIPNNCSTTVH